MRADHAFWALLTAAALIWYVVVTIYVAIRGLRDIREMIRRLGGRNGEVSTPIERDARRS